MKKYLVHIIWVIVAVVAFVGGMYYGKSTAGANGAAGRGAFAYTGGAAGARGGFANRSGSGTGLVAGQITSVNGDSITVQLPNGNSQVVFYASSTEIVKPQPAPASALTSGTAVVITGTSNSDGSLTAQSIQVRTGSSTPMFGQGAGG